MHDALTYQERLSVSPSVTLQGIAGVGKTQTVLEYVYRHRYDYEAIFWTRAWSYDHLQSELAGLAEEMIPPVQVQPDLKSTLQGVYQWFEAHSDWLLVIDDTEDILKLQPILPRTDTGRLLLTTRQRTPWKYATALDIDTLSQQQGVELLLRSARLLESNQSLKDVPDVVLTSAIEINIQLSGLPLALNMAGAYISQTGTSLVEYLVHLRDSVQSLRENPYITKHQFVADAILCTIQAVAELPTVGDAVIDLLRLCAFLASDAIPDEIILVGDPVLGTNLSSFAEDERQYLGVCGFASQYSLLHRNHETKSISIHRMVQSVIQDNLSDEESHQWAERAVTAVSMATPTTEFFQWPTCERLLPHWRRCAELISQYAIESEQSARLLSEAGHYLQERAQYAEAEAFYHQSLQIRGHVLGDQHPNTASSLNNVAIIYADQGRYAEAEPIYYQVLDIQQRALGSEHPDTARSLNNLASLYYYQGRYQEAEPLLQQAIYTYRQTLGSEHPNTANSLNNLAELYRSQGRFSEAELVYDEALVIRRKFLPESHPDIANSLNNLANLYQAQGRYQEAEPLLRRAIYIYRQALGSEHPNTANSLNNLANLYQAQSRYQEAEPLYQEALLLRRAALPQGHPDIATSLNNLGGLYANQQRYEQAEMLYKEALAIMTSALGSGHPSVATCLNSLALIYANLHDYGKASSLFQEALLILRKSLPERHPYISNALQNLVVLYERLGDKEAVKRYANELLALEAKED